MNIISVEQKIDSIATLQLENLDRIPIVVNKKSINVGQLK